jgi:N-formylglutamate amidohydrolase
MEQTRKSRWEGNELWFKFGHEAGLQRFENIKSLGETPTAIALRSLKYQLEENLGFEITDDLFEDIFWRVCNFNPKPAFGGLAGLEFVVPFKNILKRHGVPENNYWAIRETFHIFTENRRTYKKIFLHIPHSSTTFPENSHCSFNDLDNDERLLIDYYTDELFIPKQELRCIDSMVFPYCRLYCDVERLINDPLEAKGLGISYHRSLGGLPSDNVRSFSNFCTAFSLYADFHAEVAKKMTCFGDGTLLIDCHSFSSSPNLLNSNPPDIDICIGYNDDETCPNKVVIGNIVHHFKSLGYKVGLNTPFSNSKTFNVPIKYNSVMIEVNKKLYMDEYSLMKVSGFEKVRQDIQSLYGRLLKN